MTDTKRSLRVFLCHASVDKPAVRELYEHLVKNGIDAWLDERKIIPGQQWKIEISKAVKYSDVVIVCLSSQSVTKEGFVQTEIKLALDSADEKPDNTIFIIPARLESCEVPERINKFHWVDLFSDDGYGRLQQALQIRAKNLGIEIKRNNISNKMALDNRFEIIDKESAKRNEAVNKSRKEKSSNGHKLPFENATSSASQSIYPQLKTKKDEFDNKQNLERPKINPDIVEKVAQEKIIRDTKKEDVYKKANQVAPTIDTSSKPAGASFSIGVVFIIIVCLVIAAIGGNSLLNSTKQNNIVTNQSATESSAWMRSNYRSAISISNLGASGVDQFNAALTRFQITNSSSQRIPLEATMNCKFTSGGAGSFNVDYIEPSGRLEILCTYDSTWEYSVCVNVGFTDHFYGESGQVCYSP